jgi:tetratricopeptide (TPR) repeat protein
MFANHDHYQEYQRLLVALHALVAAGKNQSPEARQLREGMETVEADLSEPEIVRLNALSADLSMIHDRDIPDSEVAARVPADEVPQQIARAFSERQWGDLLDLLRAGANSHWGKDQIAYVRSRAYEGLGELGPAVAFMDEAAKRAPTNPNYRALALRLLWKSKRYEEAYSRAREYLTDPAAPPRVVLMAGGIVAQRSMQTSDQADLNTVASEAIHRLRKALQLESSANLRFPGWVALGLLAVQVDDAPTAAAAFREALGMDTFSDEQVTARLVLVTELQLVESAKAKTSEERLNAKQLAEFAQTAPNLVAA